LKDLYENNELRYFSIVSVGGKKYGFRLVSEEFSIITGEDVLQGKKTKICLSKITLEIFQNPLVDLLFIHAVYLHSIIPRWIKTPY